MEVVLQTEQEKKESAISIMLRELAEVRAEKERLTARSNELLKAVYDANPEHFKAEQDAKIEIGNLELAIKQAVVNAYNTDPTIGKKPFTGVGIRVSETTDIQYDRDYAMAWAKAHDMCLTLDTQAFESLCENKSTRPDFVVVVLGEKVGATIDRDLSKLLEVSADA